MLSTLSLLLPALLPSWRFFDSITASPRIECRTTAEPNWQEYRPRPSHLSTTQTLFRLLHNPDWNETLYLVSCCERILDTGCPHAITQIQASLARDTQNASGLTFRITLIQRHGETLTTNVAFTAQ